MSKTKIASRVLLVAAALTAALALVACDSDDDGGAAVGVSLTQFAVTTTAPTAPAGDILFIVTNNGSITHEFLVVRTDLFPGNLPTNPDGSYRENAAGTTVVAELEDIAPGTTDEIRLDLTSGNYVLLCNMVGPLGGHYSLGMRTGLSVTE